MVAVEGERERRLTLEEVVILVVPTAHHWGEVRRGMAADDGDWDTS